ncbi:hypothetical protein CU098_000285, partial [Rhizopus stolonifer]
PLAVPRLRRWLPVLLLTSSPCPTTVTHFKPDYVVFITQRSNHLDLACVEAKSSINKHIFANSGFVKLGQEMRWMLNKLVVKGVKNPVVGSILISGFQMQTNKMDTIDVGVYQM